MHIHSLSQRATIELHQIDASQITLLLLSPNYCLTRPAQWYYKLHFSTQQRIHVGNFRPPSAKKCAPIQNIVPIIQHTQGLAATNEHYSSILMLLMLSVGPLHAHNP